MTPYLLYQLCMVLDCVIGLLWHSSDYLCEADALLCCNSLYANAMSNPFALQISVAYHFRSTGADTLKSRW